MKLHFDNFHIELMMLLLMKNNNNNVNAFVGFGYNKILLKHILHMIH